MLMSAEHAYETIESTPAATDDQYMTAKEVAAFLRTDEGTLANLRARGDGIPFTRPNGKVLYKMADVLAACDAGARGFSRARLATALETFPGITTAQREKLLLHITEVLKG